MLGSFGSVCGTAELLVPLLVEERLLALLFLWETATPTPVPIPIIARRAMTDPQIYDGGRWLRLETSGGMGRKTYYPLAAAGTRAGFFLPLVGLYGGFNVAISRRHGYRCCCDVLS